MDWGDYLLRVTLRVTGAITFAFFGEIRYGFSVGFLRVLIETINRRRFGWRCYRNGAGGAAGVSVPVGLFFGFIQPQCLAVSRIRIEIIPDK
jgi:hypothetical protein